MSGSWMTQASRKVLGSERESESARWDFEGCELGARRFRKGVNIPPKKQTCWKKQETS